MKKIFVSIFLALCFTFPAMTTDTLWTEYARLKQKYPKITMKRTNIILSNCRLWNVEIDKVCGLINEESGWDSTAISSSYARGLMQILGKYHYKGRDYRDLYVDEINIPIGVRVLAEYTVIAKARYRKHWHRESYRLYNAGPNSDRDEYENWDYVDRILRNIECTRKLEVKMSVI